MNYFIQMDDLRHVPDVLQEFGVAVAPSELGIVFDAVISGVINLF